jgi:hypothetical protein
MQHCCQVFTSSVDIKECSFKLAAFRVYTTVSSGAVVASKIYNWQNAWPAGDVSRLTALNSGTKNYYNAAGL